MNRFKINQKLLGWALVLLVFVVGVVWLVAANSGKVPPGKYDALAKCIAEKNVVMYGAYWCPHCQAVKAEFGTSFQFVPYVECTQQTDLCVQKGVRGYPTFIWPDGHRLEGEQSLQQLSSATGCALPAN